MIWQPDDDILRQAMAMAHHRLPWEACGVVIDGKFLEISNRSTEVDHFAMDREEFFQATRAGGLQAIVHSHAYLPAIASQADRAMCETTGVPWLIVSVPTEQWIVIEPSGYVAPLIGRQWCHGSLDCWGVVRDGFAAFTGKQPPDFARDWDWWHKGHNTIMDHVDDAGFALLSQGTTPQHCDILIIQFRSQVPNHLGLFIMPEAAMLHQISGRVSVRETYGGFFQMATRYIARHRDFLEAPPWRDVADRSVWTGEIRGQEPS